MFMGDDKMTELINFYKELDTLNLIIFWGIIIVIVLLLIFSIIIANKNKKLKALVEKNNHDNLEKIEIPIAKQITNNQEVLKTPTESETITLNKEKSTQNNNNFVAEEHVIEYNQDIFSLSNIKKATEVSNQEKDYHDISTKYDQPNAPYQRNVLREMSLSQTSPIGIVKPIKKELTQAEELHKSLIDEVNKQKTDTFPKDEINKPSEFSNKNINSESKTTDNQIKSKEYINKSNEINNKKEENSLNSINITDNKASDQLLKYGEIQSDDKQDKYFSNNQKESRQEKYLEEVSQKLANAKELNDINRTEYELKQEEDAIISYEELMKKKDSIKIVDEEEAVISIDELMNLKNKQEKLYNLTEDEENDQFIKELKNFRKDL